ncbi:TPA: NAD-dependent epimerase/dehydratase family protein [Campylobacter lari]|uniref:NAD-dependent epimerase/dehydratase family protein n=1 Tax=Campylobacter lari TaxID=201 RepID=UPI0021F7A21A|nr:NAD-dependent epimerase/dehydratase family protein [Campylobacter lari]MCW0256976.1 NAD-dependent epimerase/dehydratase family protein [Campylobacter lari]
MKILLTGATGFIGVNFVLQLYKKYEIIALVRRTSNVEKIKDYCKIYHYDGGISSIEDVFKKEKIDGVVHLAALYKPVYNSDDYHNMFMANISLGAQILECSRKYFINFFVNTATFSQFANSISYNPKTLYDAMKQAFF